MQDWKLVRCTEDLNLFQVEFGDLSTGKKRKILDEMVAFLDDYKGFTNKSVDKSTKPLVKSKRRRSTARRG